MIALLMSLSYSGPLDWLSEQTDEHLVSIIQENINNTPDLEMAQLRIVQTSALAAQRRSGFLPSLGLGVSSNTQPRDALGFSFGLNSLGSIPGLPQDEEVEEETELFTSGSVALQLSIPIDVWGGSLESYRSALYEQNATVLDKNSAQLNLSISIAERYFDVVAAQERIRVVKEQIQLTEDLLTITELRHERAEASTLDILQQRQQLANVQSQLPRAVYGKRIAQQLMRLLLGASQNATFSYADALSVPPLFSSEELKNKKMSRPDVQAAQFRVEGAKKSEYSAMTNMFPQLSFGGQLSRQFTHSTKSEEWDKIDVYSLSTSITIPLFQGGALWNGYQASRTGTEMAEIALRQTELQAEQSIEQQIQNEVLTRSLVQNAEDQLDAAQQAFSEASRLYREGLTMSLNLISAQQSLAQAKLNVIQCKRDRLSARMQTYAAFGGIHLESTK